MTAVRWSVVRDGSPVAAAEATVLEATAAEATAPTTKRRDLVAAPLRRHANGRDGRIRTADLLVPNEAR
jgi:ribosomal protein S12 methylthiotransferase accessory factor YcaO